MNFIKWLNAALMFSSTRQKLAVKWDSLTIKDNFIFGKAMEVNSDWCRRLIEHILDIKIESDCRQKAPFK